MDWVGFSRIVERCLGLMCTIHRINTKSSCALLYTVSNVLKLCPIVPSVMVIAIVTMSSTPVYLIFWENVLSTLLPVNCTSSAAYIEL